jgi:membrane-associated PAP2 superfamily phosphatase
VPDLVVLLSLAVVTILVFQFSSLDLEISRPFFQPPGKDRWGLRHEMPWVWMQDHIGFFSVLLGLSAFGAVIFGLLAKPNRRLALYGMLVLATIAVGPGLAVNLVLKQFWGRERPRNVQEFGGHTPYRQALDPGRPGTGHSFPCGHSSMGFALGTFYFILRRRKKTVRFAALGAALVIGLLIGWARVVGGAHFFSDVIWSGLIVFFLAWLLYYFIFNIPARERFGGMPLQDHPRWALWLYGGVSLSICAGGFLASPVHHRFNYRQDLTLAAVPARLHLSIDRANIQLEFTAHDRFEILGRSYGFGFYGSRVRHSLHGDATQAGTSWDFRLKPDGYITELDTDLRIRLPASPRCAVDLELKDVELRIEADGPPPPSLRIQRSGGSVVLPDGWSAEGLHIELIDEHRPGK